MELHWTMGPTLAKKYGGECAAVITYTIDEIISLHLTPFDHRFVRECEQSDKLSDKLLLLEFYARKLEEQADNARTSTPCRTET